MLRSTRGGFLPRVSTHPTRSSKSNIQKGEATLKKELSLLITFLCAIPIPDFAAENQNRGGPQGSIRGRIVDSELELPLEYANIVLTDKDSKAQITGTIADKNGNFQLKGISPGLYSLEIKFVGYHSKLIEEIEIKPDQSELDLGTLSLVQSLIPLEGIQVEAEKPAIEFKIDKKVIHVSKQYTAVSGTAVDVLEKIPSVTVDIEGNVRLRGSSSFTVLLDSRPTALEPSEALQQIPASTIETIEIITNPSAKYDP